MRGFVSSMAIDSCPRRRRRPRPCQNLIMKNVVSAITTIGIATCCFHSSLLQTSHTTTHALSVPRLTKTSTTFPTQSRTVFSSLEYKTLNYGTTVDNQFQQRNNFCLFMAPQTPQPRRPRRMLKKRALKEGDGRRRKRNRRNRHAENSFSSSSSLGNILPGIVAPPKSKKTNVGTQEYRPLVASIRRDTGEDYWIDPEDLEREQLRKEEQEKQRESFLLRKGDEVMPAEKLMTEVKAPYRQNWIGYFSLIVAVLSIIVSQFPELLEPAPTIRFPDL